MRDSRRVDLSRAPFPTCFFRNLRTLLSESLHYCPFHILPLCVLFSVVFFPRSGFEFGRVVRLHARSLLGMFAIIAASFVWLHLPAVLLAASVRSSGPLCCLMQWP